MKYFLIICVLMIFLISANRNSDALSNSEANNISFETLKSMLQDINTRLSKLEDKFQQEENRLQETDNDNVSMKSTMTKVNKRLVMIEKKITTLDIKALIDTFKSFEDTLTVFKKKLSNASKRVEDLEISASVVEDMYRKALDRVETPKMVKKERVPEPATNDKKQTVKTIEKMNLVETREAEFTDEIKKHDESGKLKESGQSTEQKASRGIDNSFSISNVSFDKSGSSSIIRGKIKNNLDNDISAASFTMKLFDTDGKIITEFDFHIRKFTGNSIKPFEETVRDVLPSQIARYEIKRRSSF